MARLARVEVVAADEIAIVHVMNRTVRRCFLLGDDPVSGKLFSVVANPPQRIDEHRSKDSSRRYRTRQETRELLATA